MQPPRTKREPNEDKVEKVIRTDNNFYCGDWIIKAELNSKRPASLHIHNNQSKATFSYGEKAPIINGKPYSRKNQYSSLLYDEIDGEWKIKEANDGNYLSTGKVK